MEMQIENNKMREEMEAAKFELTNKVISTASLEIMKKNIYFFNLNCLDLSLGIVPKIFRYEKRYKIV